MRKLHTCIMVLIVGFSAIVANAQLTYTTGLDVWLDASDIDGSSNGSLTNGEAIVTWVNKGTTGVGDATKVGGSSTYAASNEVHQAAVTLSSSIYQPGEYADSVSRTLYFVVNRDASSGADGTLVTDYGSSGNELFTIRTGGITGQRDASGDVTWVSGADGVDVDGQWMTIFYSFDAATKTASFGQLGGTISTAVYPAGYDPTTTYEGTFGGSSTLFGFHNGDNTHDFNGLVSEVLIYDHLLDATAQTTVESYLAAKASQDPEPEPNPIFDITFIAADHALNTLPDSGAYSTERINTDGLWHDGTTGNDGGMLNHFMGADFADSVGLDASDLYEGGNTNQEVLADLTTTVTGLPNGTYDVYVAYVTREPDTDNAGIAAALSGQPLKNYQLEFETDGTNDLWGADASIGGSDAWIFSAAKVGQISGTSFSVDIAQQTDAINPFRNANFTRNLYAGVGYINVSPPAVGQISIEGPVPASGGEGMVISWMGEDSQSYDVQSKSNLVNQTEWISVTNVAGIEGAMSVTNNIDTDATFYRVVIP